MTKEYETKPLAEMCCNKCREEKNVSYEDDFSTLEIGCSSPDCPCHQPTSHIITKKEFRELTGENPEDVLGNDWENEVADLAQPTSQCKHVDIIRSKTSNVGFRCLDCKKDIEDFQPQPTSQVEIDPNPFAMSHSGGINASANAETNGNVLPGLKPQPPTPAKEWEKRFDEKFDPLIYFDSTPTYGSDHEDAAREVKDFIRKTLEARSSQLKSRLVEMAEGMKHTQETCECGCGTCNYSLSCCDHNAALDQVIELINKEL